ncbi:MAG TPA: NAD(P)-dependent alcohol dehydrogenase [Terracidiphilus sp.]|jgi:NADPH:quinone reductase-like Zn-dependent oxidoreductase
MKAAVYSKTKSGKHLEILDVPTPTPKDNEVLIKVHAASINPLDWRLKSHRPGVDVSGRIEAVGPRVTQFKPGDEVFGAAKGAFAEYACTSESKLALKPAGITFVQGASLPIAGLTALQGLRDVGHLKPSQKVLINGAAGGVGTFAVQIAKSMGVHVTAVCSTCNVEQARALGADRVIDYTRDDFTMDDERFDVLLDNVGNRPLPAMKHVLAPHGKCVMVGAPKTMGSVLARILESKLRPGFTFFVAKMKKEDLESLCSLIQSGQMTPVIDKCYPFSETAAAIAYVETGHARAKVIINVEP